MPTLRIDADIRATREVIVMSERTRSRRTANRPALRRQRTAVPGGSDAADEDRRPGGPQLLADLPLAEAAPTPTARDGIRAQVQMRDFMETLRASGEHTGGPKPYGDVERRTFANALDRWLTRARARGD